MSKSILRGAKQFIVGALLIVAGAAQAEDRLTPQLRFLPADAGAAPPDAVMFVDWAAMRDTVAARLSLVDRFGWSPQDRLLAEISRAIAQPSTLGNYTRTVHEIAQMADYVGFAWTDIETLVAFGTPPEPIVLTLRSVAPDAEAIGAALEGQGLAATDHADHTIWWRLDDDAVDPDNRDLANPLYGAFGGAARAGIVDGAFVAASNWPTLDSMLAAAGGSAPALDAAPDLVALVHALVQPVGEDGLLLQAYLMNYTLDLEAVTPLPQGADVAAFTPEEFERARQRQAEMVAAAGTPPYNAIGFGDRQEGGTEIGLIVLAYADRAAAETAAETVPAAFATQASQATEQPYAAILPFAVTADVVEAPDGRFVTRIAFLNPEGMLESPLANRNQAFDALLTMRFIRDALPLVPVQ